MEILEDSRCRNAGIQAALDTNSDLLDLDEWSVFEPFDCVPNKFFRGQRLDHRIRVQALDHQDYNVDQAATNMGHAQPQPSCPEISTVKRGHGSRGADFSGSDLKNIWLPVKFPGETMY